MTRRVNEFLSLVNFFLPYLLCLWAAKGSFRLVAGRYEFSGDCVNAEIVNILPSLQKRNHLLQVVADLQGFVNQP